jgi:ClpP class serine protease
MALLIPTRPWAILPTAYSQVLDVINREGLNLAAARERRDDHAARAVELYGSKPMDGARYMTIRNGVAIIDVYGPIARRANLFSEISGGTSIDLLARDVTSALDNPAVQSLLLVFDSPGGEVTGVSELAAALYAARGRKPMHAYVDGMACSAAYWLASACDTITTNDTALLGSIGVVMAMPDPTKTNIKEIEIVSSQSPNKRPDVTTEAGRGQIQTMLDHLADVFIQAVAMHRGVSAETVLANFGQGGVFVGQHAVDAGLADRVGSFEDTLAGLVAQTTTRRPGAAAARHQPKGETMTTMTADDQALQANLVLGTSDDIAALRAELAAARNDAIQSRASAFVQGHLTANRILPAAADPLKRVYAALATANNTDAITDLAAFCGGLPAHTLTDEKVPTGATLGLGNHTGDPAEDPEAKKEAAKTEFKNATPLGRQTLKQEAR